MTAKTEQGLLFDSWGQAKRPKPQASPDATRHAAAERITRTAGTMRENVLAFVAGCGHRGATDEEIAHGVSLRDSTARARRVELRDAGLVVDSGRTRSTSSGRAAVVWVTPGQGCGCVDSRSEGAISREMARSPD